MLAGREATVGPVDQIVHLLDRFGCQGTCGERPRADVVDRATCRQFNRLADRTQWLHGPATSYAEYGIVLFALLLHWGWWRARRTGDLMAEAGIGWAGGAPLVALAFGQLIGGLLLGGLVAFRGAKPATRLGESLLRRVARFPAGVLLTGAREAEPTRP